MMTFSINILLSLVAVFSIQLGKSAAQTEEWGYRNDGANAAYTIILPSAWNVMYPKCNGFRQSPINVDFATTVYDSSLNELTLVQAGSSVAEVWAMENNGHALNLVSNKAYSFTSLNGVVYDKLGLHFHWHGSEHEVNGKKFAGEIHLVHRSSVNATQLSVIGFIMTMAINDNPRLTPIIEKIKDIRNYKDTTTATFALDSILPMSFTSYYRYEGSLTTPTCDQVVDWILVDNPLISISENQLLELQSLREKSGADILTNARPIQPLNGRVVRRSFSPTSASAQASASGVASPASAGIAQLISASVFASPIFWMLTAYLIN